jgi:FtsP/CotA-like multicopper oxidase with cupredoxin domain
MTKSDEKQNLDVTGGGIAAPQQTPTQEQTEITSRREFLGQTIAAASGIALTGFLPSPATEAIAQTACPPAGVTSQPLNAIGQVTSQGGKLQAIMRVRNETRAVPGFSKPPMLRYFAGSRQDGTQVWPGTAQKGQPVPGPTLVAELGDVVQIALLNQTKVSEFNGTLDMAETGRTDGTGCNSATQVAVTAANPTGNPPTPASQTTQNIYPGTFDTFPNCFHASSTANLHFHGTHVTPEATGDDILFGVRPNERMNEQETLRDLQAVFNSFDPANPWHNWNDFLKSPAAKVWWDKQVAALTNYDKTGQWGSGFGLPTTPVDERLLTADNNAIAGGQWPPWFIGSFPNCYKIPKYTVDANGNPTGPVMGQAPGTHWYHAHKHGSTSLNLFNGLAGVFIIRDSSPTGYDGKLRAVYPGLKESIIVFQEITDSIGLMGGATRALLVNGQTTPMITMQPGEVQLWRMLNSTVTKALTPQIATATTTPTAFSNIIQDGLQFSLKQIAQDGVQFAWKNVDGSANGSPTGQANGKALITMAPANRIDLLVKAPSTPGCYQLQNVNNPKNVSVLLYINVTGTPKPMSLPTSQADFPTQPAFLADLDPEDVYVSRVVKYAWEDKRTATGRINGAPPRFTIDNRQFDHTVRNTMHLNEVEMWTITNNSPGVRHPFHIHQNPFQIIEIFDPTQTVGPVAVPGPWVWWDTFALPPASNTMPDGKTPRVDAKGNQVYVSGYIKMLTRFADFTGKFVNHCHILGHEDRGMMQLVEVVPNYIPTLKHH